MKKIAVMFFSLILAISLIACGAKQESIKKNDSTTKETSTEQAEVKEEKEQAEEKTEFAMNEESTLEQIGATILETRKAEKDGKNYIVTKIKVKNYRNEKIEMNMTSACFKLQNSKGQIKDSAGSEIKMENYLYSTGELAPGGEVEGEICFEIGKDEKNLKIVFEPTYDKEIKFNID